MRWVCHKWGDVLLHWLECPSTFCLVRCSCRWVNICICHLFKTSFYKGEKKKPKRKTALNRGFLHLDGDYEIKTGFINLLQDANSPPRVENGPDSPVNDKKSRKDSGSPNNASSSSSTPSSKHPKVCINCLNSSVMMMNWLAGCHDALRHREVSMATLSLHLMALSHWKNSLDTTYLKEYLLLCSP